MDSIQKILDGLTKACVNSRPSYFKPFLLSNKVTSDWPDKESFYEFLKLMISNSRKISQGKIHLIIKSIGENKSYYNFHDSINVNPILNIVIIEQNDSLHIDILPF